VRARARGTYIGSRCVWQRLKRDHQQILPTTCGESSRQLADERETHQPLGYLSVAQQKMTKAANTSTNISTTDHLSTRQTLFTLDLSTYILL
jgi:hypothetical protein